jgi:hypothetical protein
MLMLLLLDLGVKMFDLKNRFFTLDDGLFLVVNGWYLHLDLDFDPRDSEDSTVQRSVFRNLGVRKVLFLVSTFFFLPFFSLGACLSVPEANFYYSCKFSKETGSSCSDCKI